jgi:hypothetical protein
MEQQNAGKLTDFSLFVPVVLMLFLVRPGHPWEKMLPKKLLSGTSVKTASIPVNALIHIIFSQWLHGIRLRIAQIW